MKKRKVVWLCRLRELRAAAGVSMAGLARSVGVHKLTVAAAEAGYDLTLRHARALAGHFGRPVEYVWFAPTDGPPRGHADDPGPAPRVGREGRVRPGVAGLRRPRRGGGDEAQGHDRGRRTAPKETPPR